MAVRHPPHFARGVAAAGGETAGDAGHWRVVFTASRKCVAESRYGTMPVSSIRARYLVPTWKTNGGNAQCGRSFLAVRSTAHELLLQWEPRQRAVIQSVDGGSAYIP